MDTYLRLTEHDVTFWTFVLSVMALLTLVFAAISFLKSLKESRYTEIDRMYFDLLKCALDKPHVNDLAATRTETQKKEYEIYAFMVWNLMESIYDRCQYDKRLRATWYPVIDAENRLHRKWFDCLDNKHKFKDEFCRFVERGSFIGSSDVTKSARVP
jgi:hypothetical protein